MVIYDKSHGGLLKAPDCLFSLNCHMKDSQNAHYRKPVIENHSVTNHSVTNQLLNDNNMISNQGPNPRLENLNNLFPTILTVFMMSC